MLAFDHISLINSYLLSMLITYSSYFWATHAGAELDLLLLKGRQRVGVEFKHTSNPKVTQSMRIAAHDLQLDRLYIVYPGEQRYTLGEGIEAVPLQALMPG